MSKRIAETTHLAIDLDCRGIYNCTSDDILRLLHSSGHQLNPDMEILVLTQTCRCNHRHQTLDRIDCNMPTGVIMARLKDFVMPRCPKLHKVGLSLDKAPSWGMHGPTLRHMGLQIPPATIIEQEWPEEGPCARNFL